MAIPIMAIPNGYPHAQLHLRGRKYAANDTSGIAMNTMNASASVRAPALTHRFRLPVFPLRSDLLLILP